MAMIRTQVMTISSANILEVEAGGTTGGGDAGYGGRTYLRIKNLSSTYWFVRVKDYSGLVSDVEAPDEIEIVLGGDTEQSTFVAALRFAADAIEGQDFPPVTESERFLP
jgi:hypothetical protein